MPAWNSSNISNISINPGINNTQTQEKIRQAVEKGYNTGLNFVHELIFLLAVSYILQWTVLWGLDDVLSDEWQIRIKYFLDGYRFLVLVGMYFRFLFWI